MTKRILALLMVLCLVPMAALAESNIEKLVEMFLTPRTTFSPAPKLPDMKAFATEQLRTGDEETKSYLIYKQFSGKPSTLAAVAEAYAQLLQDSYNCTLIQKTTIDCGSYARIGYALSCSSIIELSEFYVYGEEDDGRHWNSGDCNVYVQYTIPDSGTSYIYFYYSPEFTYEDRGDRYVMETGGSTKVDVRNTPKPTQKPRATEKPDASTSATR